MFEITYGQGDAAGYVAQDVVEMAGFTVTNQGFGTSSSRRLTGVIDRVARDSRGGCIIDEPPLGTGVRDYGLCLGTAFSLAANAVLANPCEQRGDGLGIVRSSASKVGSTFEGFVMILD